MRAVTFLIFCMCVATGLAAQQGLKATLSPAPAAVYPAPDSRTSAALENVYVIKQRFLYHVLHNPNDIDNDDDNDLARFNRWFHMAEVRSYPSGNLPRPDALLAVRATKESMRLAGQKSTGPALAWQPVGPAVAPLNFNGIGRLNCIVIDPVDTNRLYAGAACGGVFVSHDGGATWRTNSDNFPSLSIADIAVNPRHTDTLYAATGDGYGYEDDAYDDFWGGLYSAGVMMSPDGGNSWQPTGLSYLQTNRQIIQKLLLHPRNPNILLAATRSGILRSADAGLTWTMVDNGHVYSMEFRPSAPDTVYAINQLDLKVSYDAGVTWQVLHAGINPANNRATIAASQAAPNALWILDADNHLQWSHDAGASFTATAAPSLAAFYGYYDRVLAVSPTDSGYVVACGAYMAVSQDAGTTWNYLDPSFGVHVDNHGLAINPLHPATIYSANDGGLSVTRDGGATWRYLGNGLMISQVYRMSASRQHPYTMLGGLMDCGTFRYDGTDWLQKTTGDGTDCGIDPFNDAIQIASYTSGHFNISHDTGITFTRIDVGADTASYDAPIVFDPENGGRIYFGYQDVYVSNDTGATFINLTGTKPFPKGATSLAIAPSNNNVVYACDYASMYRTTDAGATWTNVTGSLPSTTVAITGIAVDYNNPMLVYATTSGYVAGSKVYVSTSGGGAWTSMGDGIPNIPVNCIAADSSTPGALFAGTDIGLYYTDSFQTGWSVYGSGMPNVIVNDLDINYTSYKVRAATYGRGIWECLLKKEIPAHIAGPIAGSGDGISVWPNPTSRSWQLVFRGQRPKTFTLKITDVAGRVALTCADTDLLDASSLAPGAYTVDVYANGVHYTTQAVRE